MAGQKSKSASRAVKAGTNQHVKKNIRTSVHFKIPKTLRLARNPKCPRKSVNKAPQLDQFSIDWLDKVVEVGVLGWNIVKQQLKTCTNNAWTRKIAQQYSRQHSRKNKTRPAGEKKTVGGASVEFRTSIIPNMSNQWLSSDSHWPPNLPWRKSKTTTPWSSLLTQKPTNTRSKPPSKRCTRSMLPESTPWSDQPATKKLTSSWPQILMPLMLPTKSESSKFDTPFLVNSS